MADMYKLLQDIKHPLGDFKGGTVKSMPEWLDAFGVDWLSGFERKIKENPEWFVRVDNSK